MSRTIQFMCFVFAAAIVAGCGSTKQLGTIGPESVSLGEFEEMYAKNNGGWEKAAQSKIEDRKAFLDLFVKYRLKLLEARSRELLQDSSVRNELATYRASVASTYLINKEIIEPALNRLYERRKEEIHASHILIRIGANTTPEDTLKAYQQALDILARARTAPFDSLARAFSQDPSAATNGGDLGWFSQGRMVRPFEDAAFSLRSGELSSAPTRTQFGYHIIKVHDRKPNSGSVHVSHIMKRFSPTADSSQVRDSIYAIYESIKSGAVSFEDAAVRYSEDPAAPTRRGDLGVFDRSRIPPDIANILFSAPAGSVAKPFAAPYGFHIFKVNAFKPVPPFQELEQQLRQYYQQQYYASDYERYIGALKSAYGFTLDEGLRTELTHSFDSTKSPAYEDWDVTVDSVLRHKALCSFAGTTITVGQLLAHVDASDEFKTQHLTSGNVAEIVDRVVNAKLLEHHALKSEGRHPEFAELLREYENGVLIYRLDQDEIWHKITPGDSVLRIHYENSREKYRWPDRINVAEIHVRTDSVATSLYKRIQKGEDFGDLAEEFTVRSGFKEKRGEWGLLPAGTNQLLTKVGPLAVDSISEPFKFESGWSIVKVLGKDTARVKTFEEARPEVTSNYQDQASKQREREWIETLRKRYGVEIDEEKLSDAFKNPPAS
ncbi:MAG TPA: peptidylprolyl isomerase [Bacteroidota bacterium]